VVELAASAFESASCTACLNACELYVAPVTTLTFADWLAVTWAGSEAIRETGNLVVTLVIWTLAILLAPIVTETATLPREEVPVAEYIPSVYVALVAAVGVFAAVLERAGVLVADAPTTTGMLVESVATASVDNVLAPADAFADAATVAAVGCVDSSPAR
jgi:hypothetical protein